MTHRPHVFSLTESEELILRLFMAGHSRPFIVKQTGKSYVNVSNVLLRAIAKNREIMLCQIPQRGGNSSLAKARGAVRMEGTR
jgi:hypothetical protein